MFDLSQENDKIVLIQSALLIGFWFSDAQDVFQSWHWSGVAISLSQTLGLHRNPDVGGENASIGQQQRVLWRQIWWSCVLRDAWLSLGMGRPLRINLDDCDCLKPTLNDTGNALAAISMFDSTHQSDMGVAATLWQAFLELSLLLREILLHKSRPHGTTLHTQQIKQLATNVDACTDADTRKSSGLTPKVLASHLRLHQQ